jgi:hypothetical protein
LHIKKRPPTKKIFKTSILYKITELKQNGIKLQTQIHKLSLVVATFTICLNALCFESSDIIKTQDETQNITEQHKIKTVIQKYNNSSSILLGDKAIYHILFKKYFQRFAEKVN